MPFMLPLDFYAAQIMHYHDLRLSIDDRDKIRLDLDEAAAFIRIHLEQAHTEAKKLQNDELRLQVLEIVEAALYAMRGKSSFIRILDGAIVSLEKFDEDQQKKLIKPIEYIGKAIVWAKAVDELVERLWKDY